jgi:hypothetical protein
MLNANSSKALNQAARTSKKFHEEQGINWPLHKHQALVARMTGVATYMAAVAAADQVVTEVPDSSTRATKLLHQALEVARTALKDLANGYPHREIGCLKAGVGLQALITELDDVLGVPSDTLAAEVSEPLMVTISFEDSQQSFPLNVASWLLQANAEEIREMWDNEYEALVNILEYGLEKHREDVRPVELCLSFLKNTFPRACINYDIKVDEEQLTNWLATYKPAELEVLSK